MSSTSALTATSWCHDQGGGGRGGDMSKKQDPWLTTIVYAVPDPPVITLYAVQMDFDSPLPTVTSDWVAYKPQTITPEMIRAIIREEPERFERRDRKKRRRK